MQLINRAQKTNIYLGEHIFQPLLSLAILVAAVAWFTHWIQPLLWYTTEEYFDPGRWYDIVAFLSISTASFFVAFIAVKKWALILFKTAHKPKADAALSKLIKVFSIPFVISLLYLSHGVYVLLAQ